ncbi:hypothetical protein N9X25_10095 [Verrucomicrobiales bacterium]|nr:hypothetical protein [Verrucomicrobiales bacterium]
MIESIQMNRKITALVLSAALLTGCGGGDSNQGPLDIGREFVTVHEEGLGTIRFFEPREIGDGLWAKCFAVPPTFLGSEVFYDGKAADPFAEPIDKEKVQRIKRTAQGVLEEAGISFGENHFARYYPSDSALVVVLPIEQMELVEAYLSVIGSGPPRPISVFAEIYEVEEEFHMQLQQTLRGEADHTPERDALFEAAKQNEVALIEAMVLSTHSGMRSKSEKGEGGAELETDVVLSADGRTADVAIRYQENRGGTERSAAENFSVDSSLVMELGDYAVAGSWKTEDADASTYRYLVVKADAPPES